MERNFNIQFSYLKDLYNELMEFRNDADVLKDCYRLEMLIERYRTNFSDAHEESLSELIEDDISVYQFYKPFYPFVKEFVNTGFSSEDLDCHPTYRNLDISNTVAFNETGNFFSNQGGIFYDGFLEFDEECDGHLQFVDKDANTDGEVFFLKSTGDAFVFCPNYTNITKLTILVHEIEHVIDAFKNPLFFDNTTIRETAALFMEMLACDYFAKKFNLGGDNYKRRLFLHSAIKNEAELLVDKIELLELWKKYKNIGNDKLFIVLEDNGFSLDYIRFLMQSSITQNFYYPIAQLIAIELYYIYRQNGRYALSILEDIILNGNNDNIFELLKKYGIKLISHVEQYEKNLLKKVKKQ